MSVAAETACAEHLLGRGVVERQRASCQSRECGLVRRRASPSSSLAMPKSSSLTSPVRGDQHVARLEVAVHDQAARARTPPRPRPARNSATRAAHVELAARAVRVDRLALDVLERQVRPPVGAEPGVVQLGDVRMDERGQDVALARHALHQPRTDELGGGSLSATWRWKLPSARSASQTTPMPPRAISRSRRYGPIRSPTWSSAWNARRDSPGPHRGRLGHVLRAVEQFAQQRHEVTVARVEVAQPALALGACVFEPALEQPVQPPPVGKLELGARARHGLTA